MPATREPIKAHSADAGCWIDGHWGQYGIARMVEMARGHGYSDAEVCDLASRHIRTMGGSDAPELTTDEHEALGFAADAVEAWLNQFVAPDGYGFEWDDGEFFLRELVTPGVCQNCGVDSDGCDGDEHGRHCWWVVNHYDGRDQVA